MTYQFDTSGRVRRGVITPRGTFSFRPGFVRWPDLSPFTQGYVEALFKSAAEPFPAPGVWMAERPGEASPGIVKEVGFSDLAPETLARIMEDCERRLAQASPPYPNTHEEGRRTWERRQGGKLRQHGFPPLTPCLGEDGKVRL